MIPFNVIESRRRDCGLHVLLPHNFTQRAPSGSSSVQLALTTCNNKNKEEIESIPRFQATHE
jgi:hypothetical protein